MPGLKILAAYGAYTEHTLYYVVEADGYDSVEKFLSQIQVLHDGYHSRQPVLRKLIAGASLHCAANGGRFFLV